jgi:hypothetical protein
LTVVDVPNCCWNNWRELAGRGEAFLAIAEARGSSFHKCLL